MKRNQQSQKWHCDGVYLYKGCASSRKSKVVYENGEGWSCNDCEVDYGAECIQAYSGELDPKNLMSFTKNRNIHHSHEHALALCFGSEGTEVSRKLCYGKYNLNGCTGKGNSGLRYLVCYKCNIVLGEIGFMNLENSFSRNMPQNIHPHSVSLKASPEEIDWAGNVKTPYGVKKDMSKNKQDLFTFRCERCDFDMCRNCAASLQRNH